MYSVNFLFKEIYIEYVIHYLCLVLFLSTYSIFSYERIIFKSQGLSDRNHEISCTERLYVENVEIKIIDYYVKKKYWLKIYNRFECIPFLYLTSVSVERKCKIYENALYILYLDTILFQYYFFEFWINFFWQVIFVYIIFLILYNYSNVLF